MAITTSCPKCNAQFRLPDDLAGKQVRCEQCAEICYLNASRLNTASWLELKVGHKQPDQCDPDITTQILAVFEFS